MSRTRRPTSRRAAAAAGELVATTLLAGCGGAEVVTVGDVTVLVGERTGESMDALLAGRLAVVDGCLGVESQESAVSYVVVWPHGTEVVDGDPLTVAVPGDGDYSVGDLVQVGGGESSGERIGGIDVEGECPGAATWLATE